MYSVLVEVPFPGLRVLFPWRIGSIFYPLGSAFGAIVGRGLGGTELQLVRAWGRCLRAWSLMRVVGRRRFGGFLLGIFEHT